MAEDQQVTDATLALRPYLKPLLGTGEMQGCDDAIMAGEPIEALGWYFDTLTDQTARTIPYDTLMNAFALLEDEDKELYRHLLPQRHPATV